MWHVKKSRASGYCAVQVIIYKGGDCCHLQLCEKVQCRLIFRHGGLLIP